MIKVVILFVVLICIDKFEHSASFKWVPYKSGDLMPLNAIRLDSNFNKYVGRIHYLNTIQLAEIHKDSDTNNITHGVLILYSNEIVRHEFEVLIATEHCEWLWYDKTNVPENIVRGGTAWNLEPVFIAKRQTSYDVGIASIYLTSDKIQSSPKYSDGYTYALICDENTTWVDATSTNVPESTVRAGEDTGNPIYVARLLGPLSHVPGNVVPGLNKTLVIYKDYELSSFNIQVLVEEETEEYSWYNMQAGSGIPDYAVVCGISENNELMYLAKINIVFPILFSETRNISFFDILVKSVK
ncbi:uncharacterized protein LOC129911475 [Episyrphus balteatus]|uniref:uncharacterized protein LOC129911475 n=1 Tax=Episyrphus balteatus TaxID=286459 RepID=UPI0024850109|nr:uncharacterized protein LOC129911475 [Episyrphus balteatus]